MNFFQPSKPAGRLEFFVVWVITSLIFGWATYFYLQFDYNVETEQVSYIARNLPLYSVIVVLLFGVQILIGMRRLTDMRKPTGAAFALFLPLIGALMGIWLSLTKRPKTMGYAPYGDDPLDPQSWTPQGPAGQPVASFQGKEMRLPGDDQRAA